MRKSLLALSAIAAAVIFASVSNRTEAAPLGNPGTLSGALDELNVLDSVHCRPGRRHHRPNDWRRADGCVRRGARGAGVVIVPGRTQYIWRDGVRVRVNAGDRGGRNTVRTRTDVNVRTGGGDRDRVRNNNQRSGGAGQTTGTGSGPRGSGASPTTGAGSGQSGQKSGGSERQPSVGGRPGSGGQSGAGSGASEPAQR